MNVKIDAIEDVVAHLDRDPHLERCHLALGSLESAHRTDQDKHDTDAGVRNYFLHRTSRAKLGTLVRLRRADIVQKHRLLLVRLSDAVERLHWELPRWQLVLMLLGCGLILLKIIECLMLLLLG